VCKGGKMKNIDNEISDSCIQVRNMIKFLLLSIKSGEEVSLPDIAKFLERVYFLIDNVCSKIKE